LHILQIGLRVLRFDLRVLRLDLRGFRFIFGNLRKNFTFSKIFTQNVSAALVNVLRRYEKYRQI
jgi:hypothetical protein